MGIGINKLLCFIIIISTFSLIADASVNRSVRLIASNVTTPLTNDSDLINSNCSNNVKHYLDFVDSENYTTNLTLSVYGLYNAPSSQLQYYYFNYTSTTYELLGSLGYPETNPGWDNISWSNSSVMGTQYLPLKVYVLTINSGAPSYSLACVYEVQAHADGGINNISSIPNISSPINSSRHYNNSINYTWNQSTDVDGDSITYNYQLSIYSNFSTIFNQSNVTNNWTGSITGLADGTTYFGRVRSYDGYEYSNWSNTIQFTENTKSVYTNVTLSPSTPTSLQNLTVSFNVTDSESDTPTNYTRWYKDNILQTTLNNSLTVLASGNTSNGQKWRVDVFGYDGYENSTPLSSNEVIIGSSNAPPVFTSLSISPSTGQIGTVITINASGITDDSQVWRAQTYYLIGDGSKVYLGNSSWSNESYITYTVSSPWSDSETRVIYTNIYDSGNLTGYENLTSSSLSQYFVSQLTTVSTSTGGGGGVIIITPTPTPVVTEYKPSIDITSIGESSLGIILLEILLLGGFIVLISGLLEEGKMSSLIVGFIVVSMSIYGLGWLS